MDDVSYILHGLPSAQIRLVPEFFGRVSLPFRLLRRSHEMHLVNPVPKQDVKEVFANAGNQEQCRLAEYAGLLLFLGAHKNQIFAASKLSQNNCGTSPILSLQAEESEPSTQMRIKTVPARKYRQDLRSDSEDNPGYEYNGSGMIRDHSVTYQPDLFSANTRSNNEPMRKTMLPGVDMTIQQKVHLEASHIRLTMKTISRARRDVPCNLISAIESSRKRQSNQSIILSVTSKFAHRNET